MLHLHILTFSFHEAQQSELVHGHMSMKKRHVGEGLHVKPRERRFSHTVSHKCKSHAHQWLKNNYVTLSCASVCHFRHVRLLGGCVRIVKKACDTGVPIVRMQFVFAVMRQECLCLLFLLLKFKFKKQKNGCSLYKIFAFFLCLSYTVIDILVAILP